MFIIIYHESKIVFVYSSSQNSHKQGKTKDQNP